MAEQGHQYIYKKETIKEISYLIPKKAKVLDLGCGTGHIAQALAQNREWHGIDISPKSIKIAEKYYKKAIVGDMTKNTGYEKESFDVVLLLSSLHHVYLKKEDVIKEATRVLKEEGKLIIIDPNSRNLSVIASHHPLSPIRVVPCKYEKPIDPLWLRKYLEKNSFIVEILYYTEIKADQQGVLAPFWKRAIKAPFNILARLISNGNTDFILMAKKGVEG